MTTLEFLQTLFNEGEKVCYSSTPFGTFAWSLESWRPDDVYFSINPLLGARADSNVGAYRNILLEFDSISLDEQKEIIKEIPYSTLVYSGGKSLHAIISLSQPCETPQSYRMLVERIYKKYPQADKANKNPSRFSRLGGQFRPDTEKLQTILDLRPRLTTEQLEKWLGPEPVELPKPRKHRRQRLLGTHTRRFLRLGAPEGSWNLELFKAACEMARCNIEEDEALELVEAINGYLTTSDRRTIGSAYKNALREQSAE